ncbi:MAG: hypothetical protein IJS54_01205 [Desulfovibrio sp.]|nr:hypothetical protein [Desulfovibrio sp.]
MVFFRRSTTHKTPKADEILRAKDFLRILAQSVCLLGFVWFALLLPYAWLWLFCSGDVAVDRAVASQTEDACVLFGSGVSQDFVDYKLRLYAQKKPTIVALGSSRVMQFRESSFTKPFCNMGGVAGNLPVLRSTIDAMLAIHKPEAIILGLDFWWFMPAWNKDPFALEPPTSGSYTYSLSNLKKFWQWVFEGKLSVGEFFAPFLGVAGHGFFADRFGIMAQTTNDGFAQDGSWYYTAETTGQKKPFDYQFRDTLTQVVHGMKAFYHVPKGIQAPNPAHLDALAELLCRLHARGIRVYVVIPPVAESVYKAMREREEKYPHCFGLANALRARGIAVLDCTNPRTLGSNDCEFVDGFHGGEITYLRILRSLCDQWSTLLSYVHLDALHTRIASWKGHVYAHDDRVTDLWEVDFNDFGCKKRSQLR